MARLRWASLLAAFGLAALSFGGAAAAGEEAGKPAEYWDDPLVVAPSGQPMRASESPSTTFVITGEEVRRSGATSLPEILRQVPGLDVRIITATDGVLGLRGFAYEITDRILVMVDGRTVYIDFFGGTSYEMLPVSLVDVEQIEVVLGPGASVYGNKAMLGTVNIITRSAADYPLAEARIDAGPPGDGRVAARWGARQGPWRLRVTGLGRRLTPYDEERAAAAAGGGTFSLAYSPSPGSEASVEIGGMRGETYMIPTGTRIERFDGTVGYVRGRARLGLGGPGAPRGYLNLDLVWNAGVIDSPTFPNETGTFRATYHTPYAQAHHELRAQVLGAPMQVRWGGEVRLNTLDSTITAGEEPVWNVAAFASDEIQLGRWRLTAGLRVDRSTLTPTSFSPRLSVVWSPVERHQLRAAFNTGYNNAHLLNYFADFDVSDTVHVRGTPDLAAERVIYGELGWNGRLAPWLRAFATAFAYRFTDWISLDPMNATPGGVPYGNNEGFEAYGGEAGFDVLLGGPSSRAYATYAFLGPKGAGQYPYQLDPHGSPQHKVSAGLHLGLPPGPYLSVDAQYFGPSAVARVAQSPTAPSVFEITELDAFLMAHARVGYAFGNGFDVSLAGSNLFDDRTRHFPGAEAPERRLTATVAFTR